MNRFILIQFNDLSSMLGVLIDINGINQAILGRVIEVIGGKNS